MATECVDLPHTKSQDRILIVDDDRDFAGSLVALLEPRGYRLEQAHGIAAACRIVRGFDAQLALLDIRLENESGLELIPKLKDIRPEILCVMITAYAEVDSAVAALQRGAYDYLRKPLSPLALFAAVDRCFERQRLERARAEAQASMRRAVERLRLLSSAVEQSSEGIAVTDLEGKLLFLNDAFARLHGYSPRELIGKSLAIFHSREQMPAVEAANREVKETGSFSGEVWHARRNGTVFPALVHNSLLRDDAGKAIGLVGTLRDVTENKRIEEAMRTSEEKFRAITENTEDVTVIVGRRGKYRYVSPSVRNLSGYSPADVISKSPAHFLHPDDLPAITEILKRAFEKPAVTIAMPYFRVRSRDGAWLYLEGVATGMPNVTGVDGVVVNCRDITERKRAEEALQESRSFLQTVIDGDPDPLVVIDPEYRILLVNRAGRTRAGRPDPASKPLTCYRVLHGLDAPCTGDDRPCPLNEALATGRPATVEHRHVGAGGTESVIEIATAPIFGKDGEVTYFIESLRDITERRRMEEALREERDFAESLIQTAQTVILVLDTEGRIVRYNPYMEELSGYELEETRGKDWFDSFLPERDRDRIRRLFAQAVGDTQTRGNVNPIVTKNGSKREIEWYDRTLKDRDGNVVGMLVVGQDITERKHLEEQLRHSQKMEAIGQLAGGVAHDFNNLLTAILGNTEMLLRSAKNDVTLLTSEAAKEGLEQVRTAGRRAAALTRQLLAFSRKQVTEPEVLDPNRLVMDMEKLLRRLIGENVTLEVSATPAAGRLYADAGQIEQVIMNLVINASDAMPAGGTLTIEVADANLDDAYVSTHPEATRGPHVMLAVSDTGVGMTSDKITRIFEPFYTTKPIGKGTGLGLATAYGIVREAGGHLEVESTPGQGSTFRVYLPAAEDQGQGSPSASSTD